MELVRSNNRGTWRWLETMKPPFLPPDMSKRSFSCGGSAKKSRARRVISATSAASTPWSTTWKMPQPSHAAATRARISPRRAPPSSSMPSSEITGTSSLKLSCGTRGRSSSSRTNDGRSVASDDAVGRNGTALLTGAICGVADVVRRAASRLLLWNVLGGGGWWWWWYCTLLDWAAALYSSIAWKAAAWAGRRDAQLASTRTVYRHT
jgi:hypothetical protein